MKINRFSKARSSNVLRRHSGVPLLLTLTMLMGVNTVILADTFPLPANGDNLVGTINLTSSVYSDTISDIARMYDQGFKEMRIANPGVDAWIPGENTDIIIPSFYVLPDAPFEGMVINVPEMRLYYYPRPARGETPQVITHPISIGRQDWATPHGLTKIVKKVRDPAWYPPASIRKEHAENDDPLPTRVAPGPDNPLGAFAMRLGIPGYLIHGTNKPYGIGMRVTHGCVRMYPKDIASLFPQVPLGTPVRIVNQPYKIGRLNNILYMEVHPFLDEDKIELQDDEYNQVVSLLVQQADLLRDLRTEIDWQDLRAVLAGRDGLPISIGQLYERATSPTEPAMISQGDGVEEQFPAPF